MFDILKNMKPTHLTEEDKKTIIQDLNLKIGGDINDLSNAYELENELIKRRDQLKNSLHVANNLVPTKLSSAIKKAENNSNQIQNLKEKSEKLKIKVDDFLQRTEPLRTELNKRFSAINKLDQVLIYLRSFEKIEDLSRQMKQCNDDEQLVLLYGELKDMCLDYKTGHRAAYVREYTHYWHNILKDKLTKHYEDVLKLIKWPLTTGAENPLPSKDALIRFYNLTRYLFLIEEPEEFITKNVSEEIVQELDPCLPVKILLKPLKKRFIFHFTGSRQTARIDRPEWFLTQTLTWIKDHQAFVKTHVQPVADKLEIPNVKAVDEFNSGLIALAAERLHTVLALYHAQGSKTELVDVDAAFAHAVDETLGFHKELITVTGKDSNSVLAVLTKAETFVRWLAVEKKYALAKMDEMLSNDQWCEPVALGVGSAVGSMLWVPRGADWFIALLKTIEERYAVLPQPGHRLQFLELQLELIEEWRVRLTQLLSAAVSTLTVDSLLTASTGHPLLAHINTAHHTRSVLLQWAHCLHYLQLHYYRRQFQHFTHQQHRDDTDSSSSSDDDDSDTEENTKKSSKEGEIEETMSLKEVEIRAKKLALNEVSRRNSMIVELGQFDVTSPIANLAVTEPLGAEDAEEAGVFAEAPALLAHLRDAGLAALSEHILLEFKAGLRDYKKQKWHAWPIVEESALSVSAALCAPLAGACARLARAARALAPPLTARLRAQLARDIDHYLYEEVVLENWFNTGGTVQFTHDVKRNLLPAFMPPNKVASLVNHFPKLLEACNLLNMDYDDARRLRSLISKTPNLAVDHLTALGIRHIPPNECQQILNQRTDLSETTSPSSVMELF
ncbi:RAD50-interacting protein 1 [Amyelois transitella]|uniref:RAD50-interacting protein 1 n=1 Tax=Amyelois transitella TaxID=680683 RepID=UPI00298F9CDD|nr:RAD50-interacting protein 1 [Amyelois transitella]